MSGPEPGPASFGARLRDRMVERGRLCVGIDPHPQLLSAWGLPDTAPGVERFARTVVDALADRVPVLKPQSAFFERHGAAGVAVLERTLRYASAAGALVLLDAKRGDIGSTAAAYADAYLAAGAPLAADAVTLNPFLGFESLRPVLDAAAANGRGVFVLALTSNPEGAEVQLARRPDGCTVAEDILRRLAAENAGAAPWGSCGAVVAATVAAALPGLDINGPILAPGFGAQGGDPDDLRRVFAERLGDVLVHTSRDVLRAGPDPAGVRRAALTAARAVERVVVDPPAASSGVSG